jgi:hypothetical protein
LWPGESSADWAGSVLMDAQHATQDGIGRVDKWLRIMLEHIEHLVINVDRRGHAVLSGSWKVKLLVP